MHLQLNLKNICDARASVRHCWLRPCTSNSSVVKYSGAKNELKVDIAFYADTVPVIRASNANVMRGGGEAVI